MGGGYRHLMVKNQVCCCAGLLPTAENYLAQTVLSVDVEKSSFLPSLQDCSEVNMKYLE